MSPANIAIGLNRAGLVLTGGAAVFAEVAWLHMRSQASYGVICGDSSSALAHCAACYASASLLTLGIASFLLANAAPPARLQPGSFSPHNAPQGPAG